MIEWQRASHTQTLFVKQSGRCYNRIIGNRIIGRRSSSIRETLPKTEVTWPIMARRRTCFLLSARRGISIPLAHRLYQRPHFHEQGGGFRPTALAWLE